MLTGLCISVYAQEIVKTQKLSDDGNVSMTIFNENVKSRTKADIQSIFQNVLKLNSETQLSLLSSDLSGSDLLDEKYQQYYKGVKVEFGNYFAHYKNGSPTSINGSFYNISQFNITPSLSNTIALESALRFSRGKSFMWENPDYAKLSGYKKP